MNSATMSLWRIELLHPLLVHFPIAFLTLGTVLFAGAMLRGLIRPRSTERADHMLWAAELLLVLGTVFAWGAIFSGREAEDVVNRYICDPTMTHHHEDLADIATWIFSAVSVLLLAARLLTSVKAARKLAQFVTLLGSLIGIWYLMQAGHAGFELVYLQGAGVYRTTEDCREFSE